MAQRPPKHFAGYKCCGFYPTLSVWFITLLRPILNKWDKFWQAGVCSWSHMLYFFGYQKHLMAKLGPFFIHPTSKREKLTLGLVGNIRITMFNFCALFWGFLDRGDPIYNIARAMSYIWIKLDIQIIHRMFGNANR